MTDDRFVACFGQVLKFEGGYVDDPRDPGGATNLGVTRATLSRAFGRPASLAELKALTPEAVEPVYLRLYWRRAGCDRLAAGLDLLVFDSAVNMGVGAARRLLAAGDAEDTESAILKISMARRSRYLSLRGFDVFGAGWLRRLDEVTAKALAEAKTVAEKSIPQGEMA